MFYIHLSILIKAGPHDNIMTSAFQASLEVCCMDSPVTTSHNGQNMSFSRIPEINFIVAN